MRILDVSEMERYSKSTKYFYNSFDFHMLNRNKAEKVLGFVFGENKARACLIGGIYKNTLKFPYSSPFSMFEMFHNNKIEDIDEYIRELENFGREIGLEAISIKLPPMFYDETNISKVLSSLLRAGFKIEEMELNYQLYLRSMEYYQSSLFRNAKKNLKHAQSFDISLISCKDDLQEKKAYDIIKANRESKNYYLAMTWDEVYDTIQLVDHDIFILDKEGEEIAAAIIFKVTEDIYQVVYWGDMPGYSDLRPINYLSYALYEYYLKKGARVLDIGPSMIDGHPNFGLCDFKESIGCDVSSKFVLKKKIQ